MPIFSFLIGFSLFASVALAGSKEGPIHVGNGGGSSEFSVIFTRANLMELLRDCERFCVLSDSEKNEMRNLINVSQRLPELQFRNATILGKRLFLLVNQKTEVWINQDELWLDKDKTIPYGVSNALGLWMDILAQAHHVQIANVRPIVIQAFKNKISVGQLETPKKDVFEFLHWKKINASDVLVLRDPALQSIDVTAAVAKSLQCQGANLLLQMYSPSWVPLNFGDEESSQPPVLSMQFGLKWQCGSRRGSVLSKLIVEVKLNENHILSFDLNSIIVQTR